MAYYAAVDLYVMKRSILHPHEMAKAPRNDAGTSTDPWKPTANCKVQA